MGCKNGDLSDESAVSLTDALLFATMCIIGLPVEVHVKDGSIYAGIFYTASVEKDYGVVLKRARMIKKGKASANLSNGALIDTLVVLSGDLVQVVSKGVLLPAHRVVSNIVDDKEEAVAETDHVTHTSILKQYIDNGLTSLHQCTILDQIENGSSQLEGEKVVPKLLENVLEIENWSVECMNLAKVEESSGVPLNGGETEEDKSREKDGYEQIGSCKEESAILEDQCTTSSVDTCFTQPKSVEGMHVKITSKKVNEASSDTSVSLLKAEARSFARPTYEDFPSSSAIPSDVSTSTKVIDITLQPSLPSSSASQTGLVPPRSMVSSTNTKEFKLNPGAKTFSPSFPAPISAMPPALPAVASMAYIPNSSSALPVVSAQPEIVISPFAQRSSLPVKFVQYENLAGGNGGSNAQYSAPIVGNVGNRLQPVRYPGQYHPVQAGPAYIHPNTQPIMVGRLGQLIYVHPASHDVVQGAGAFSQVSACPLPTPHPAHLPKHQGNAAAQALQLCVNPPFIASAQQPFAAPSHIPQPSFSSIRPISVSSINGLYGSKFP